MRRSPTTSRRVLKSIPHQSFERGLLQVAVSGGVHMFENVQAFPGYKTLVYRASGRLTKYLRCELSSHGKSASP